MAASKFPTAKELREMSTKDRTQALNSAVQELAVLIPLIKTGKDKQSHKKIALRKQIARIQTINSDSQHA